MPRKPRIEYAGALYHVMSRGDHGAAIAADERERARFVKTLGEACARTGWVVHAYVLMTNHYHVLLETPEANLVAGMKWLQGTYTARHNARHQQHGHLFQGRYKAVPIDGNARGYYETVSTYVHLNPVRAGMLGKEQRLRGYAWSSYPAYVGQAVREEWLEVGSVLGALGLEDDRRGREAYERYMEGRVGELGLAGGRERLEAEWKVLRQGWGIGGEEFRAELMGRLETVLAKRRRESYSGGEMQSHDERAAERLVVAGLEALGLEEEGLGRLPKGALEKRVLAWWVKGRTHAGNRWLAGRLQMGVPNNVPAYAALAGADASSRARRLRSRLISKSK